MQRNEAFAGSCNKGLEIISKDIYYRIIDGIAAVVVLDTKKYLVGPRFAVAQHPL
jgi:hypothetical protein